MINPFWIIEYESEVVYGGNPWPDGSSLLPMWRTLPKYLTPGQMEGRYEFMPFPSSVMWIEQKHCYDSVWKRR